jgi:Ca2+-binding RTX toxin-like protein
MEVNSANNQAGFSAQNLGLAASSTALRTRIDGTSFPDVLLGTAGDDDIFALDGDDIILGTTGNDVINGGSGFDTIDYSNVGLPVTLFPRGLYTEGTVHAGQLISIEKIVGAVGQANKIDGSTALGGATFDVDLGANRATINNIPGLGSQTFTVENFVDVIGTPSADKIVGSAANNNLSAGAGNDTLNGGAGSDTLLGTDSLARGVGEQDQLTGGSGRDRFILGDTAGSFYVGQGNQDYAQITDFSFGEQIQLGAGETYRIRRAGQGFNLFTTTGGTSDLVARVQFERVGCGMRHERSSAGSSDSLSEFLREIPREFSLAAGQTLGFFTGAA